MVIKFLGTNGWYDTTTGNTLCVWIETQTAHIVFDAGTGLHKLDGQYDPSKPVFLLLSHFHLDHVIGLHGLGRFDFRHGLNILGPPGTRDTLANLLQPCFSLPLERMRFKTEIHELPSQIPGAPFRLEALPLRHSTPCYGYRVETEGRTICFCTDTGPCENAVRLARGADILVCECSLRDGQSDEDWGHLNPRQAAQLAKDAEAKQLILVHFDAREYPSLADREKSALIARTIFKETRTVEDDAMIRL
jgi:ribonuclease Z